MPVNRREILSLMAAGVTARAVIQSPAVLMAQTREIKAIAFDGFPILDPRPIFGTAKKLFPEKGGALGLAFRTRLFEYQWLRALAGQYKDFYSIIEDALVFATNDLGLELTDDKRRQFMAVFLKLKAEIIAEGIETSEELATIPSAMTCALSLSATLCSERNSSWRGGSVSTSRHSTNRLPISPRAR